MLRNFRGKNTKDTENPAETIIFNTTLNSINHKAFNTFSNMSITRQHSEVENFDGFIEKRK
jgi:hypothetical protein